MGIGYALGGVASGLQQADQSRVAQQEIGLRRKQLGLNESRLAFDQAQAQRKAQLEPLSQFQSMAEQIWKSDAPIEAKQKALLALEPAARDLDGLTGTSNASATLKQLNDTLLPEAPKSTEDQFGKPPSGYRYNSDGTLTAIPGGPATKIAAGDAGRLAMLQTAKDGFDKQAELLTKDWGPEETAKAAAGVGDIGRAQRQTSMMIESAVRAASGGTVKDEEIDYYESLFMPKVTDSVETRKDKLTKLRAYAARAEAIATQGRGAPGDAKKLAEDVGATDNENPIEAARLAIQQGAPRDAVIQRLIENGIDPSGTGL